MSKSDEARSEVISRVHHQLANDFYPALKNAADAAVAFKTTQENNQKAFSNYISSLKHVVMSAKTAESDAQDSAKELTKLIKYLMKINDETVKFVNGFSEIALKLHSNAETEKSNHRKLIKKYLKDQQHIHREYDKKRMTSTDLKSFYQKNYDEAVRLQHLRYKYFTDKHLKLLKKFEETSHMLADDFNSNLNDLIEHSESVKNETKENNNSDTINRSVSRPVSVRPESIVTEPTNKSITREEEPLKLPSPPVERHHHQNDLMSPMSHTDDTIGRFFKELKEEESAINHEEVTPTVVPTMTPYSPENSEHDQKLFIKNRTTLQQVYVPPPREEIKPLPRPTPKPRQEEPIRPIYNNGYQPIPIVPPRTYEPAPVVLQSPPPAPKRREKQPFTASDYGSILICTEAFTARTERQLSLNVGDAAELIRCGERGWLLIRTFSANSQSLGWFPAKFVRLATTVEEEQRLQSRN